MAWFGSRKDRERIDMVVEIQVRDNTPPKRGLPLDAYYFEATKEWNYYGSNDTETFKVLVADCDVISVYERKPTSAWSYMAELPKSAILRHRPTGEYFSVRNIGKPEAEHITEDRAKKDLRENLSPAEFDAVFPVRIYGLVARQDIDRWAREAEDKQRKRWEAEGVIVVDATKKAHKRKKEDA